MPLRLRRDSETSSDSWSIVEDQNVDVLRDSDDDDSIYSESEVDSDVEEVFDEEEEESDGEDEEEQEENEPIVEEPSSDEEVEQQQEGDDYMSSEHSDLEIQETQDEEDEELSILELCEKLETAVEERSNIPVIFSISIISMIYSVGVIFLTTPDTVILSNTNSPINYPAKIIPSFMYTISNITLPMSPIKKPLIVLDGPVPPVSVCMPSKPRNLSVFGGVLTPEVSPIIAPLIRKLPPKSFFSKFKPKYSSKNRGEMEQMPTTAIFTSKRRDLSPIYNLRSSTRTTRKATRPSPASATLQKTTTKNLPSVIYEQNTTLWRVKRNQKINKKSASIVEKKKKKNFEILMSQRIKRDKWLEQQKKNSKIYLEQCEVENRMRLLHEAEESRLLKLRAHFSGRQKERKALGYHKPLPCVPPKYKPSKPQQVPKPSSTGFKKQATKPSFDWVQRRAQVRKSLREMY